MQQFSDAAILSLISLLACPYLLHFLDQELISYRFLACYSCCCCSSSCWGDLFKKPKIPSFQWNLAGYFFKQIRIAWRSWIFDLTSYIFQEGDHDVISRRKLKRCRLVSKREASAGAYAAMPAPVSSWSTVHSYLFLQ